MKMDLSDQNREHSVRELLADLDVVALTSGAKPPPLRGGTGPRPLELEPDDVFIDPAPVQYSFDTHDVRLDIFPGVVIFHISHTDIGSHQRLQEIFRRVSDDNTLLLEALWFDDTLSSQISLVQLDRAQ